MRQRWNVAQFTEHAPAAASLAFAAEHTFERVSVARDYDLQTEALRHGAGPDRVTGTQRGDARRSSDGCHVDGARGNRHQRNAGT